MASLDGKVALVTGAASGIGRASALAFAREGSRVVVVDMQQEKGEETVNLIEKAGGEAVFVKTDVSSSSEVQTMVHTAVETFGGLDFAMNNAAYDVGRYPLAEMSEETWNKAIAVDLTGVFLCMKYEIQAMLKRGGGAMVNVSSAAAYGAQPGMGWYIAAKSGVMGLSRVAALEYGKQGIRVNTVCPGAIMTSHMQEAVEKNPQHLERLLSKTPIGRPGEPEEIAEAAVWLCSNKSSFVLGHELIVDGGFVLPS